MKSIEKRLEAIEKQLNILPKAMDSLEEYLNAGCKESRRQASIKAKKIYEEYHGRAYKNKNEEVLEIFKERGFGLYKVEEIEKKLRDKPLHEVGNWYRGENGHGCVYMTKDNKEEGDNSFKGYGINRIGVFENSDNGEFYGWSKKYFNIKLTPEEAYERLKKWFIGNGYKKGVKVRCLVSGVDFTLSEKPHPYLKKIINTGTFFAMSDSGIYICLMQNGNLAEIVEDEKPRVGDYVKAWDENVEVVAFGLLIDILEGSYVLDDHVSYDFAKKITKEQYEQVKNL